MNSIRKERMQTRMSGLQSPGWGVAYGAFAPSLGQRHEGEEREAVWLSGGQQRQRLLDEVNWHVDRTARRPRWPERGAGVCK